MRSAREGEGGKESEMIEPTIECTEDFTQHRIYRLVVPMGWLIGERFPRLKLWWWLTKLIWKARPDGR